MQYFVSQEVPGDHGFWAVDPFPSLHTARVWGQNRLRWGPDNSTVEILEFIEGEPTVIETING